MNSQATGPRRIMLVAGETSGDRLAAELVWALRAKLTPGASASRDLQPTDKQTAPRFFGAGGPAMAEAGVEIEEDMMGHAVTGLTEVVRSLTNFRRVFHRLRQLAINRQPDLLICVDFSGFNRPLAHAIGKAARSQHGAFANWRPRIVQYVSPQVWASRPGRAWKLAGTVDLLLSIIPFEQDWYAQRTPQLNVQFVGHPILDRYRHFQPPPPPASDAPPIIALLPGSRTSELKRHLPPILEAVQRIAASQSVRFQMVLPDERMLSIAQAHNLPKEVEVRVGGLPELLSNATMAIASTGTVTMECAYFGVPTIAMYKASELTFQIGRRIATVTRMAMPNLIANDDIFPEYIQHAATGEHLSETALRWLNHPEELAQIRHQLADVMDMLGEPGASQRATQAILDLWSPRSKRLTTAG